MVKSVMGKQCTHNRFSSSSTSSVAVAKFDSISFFLLVISFSLHARSIAPQINTKATKLPTSTATVKKTKEIKISYRYKPSAAHLVHYNL